MTATQLSETLSNIADDEEVIVEIAPKQYRRVSRIVTDPLHIGYDGTENTCVVIELEAK